ncbi:MAG: transglutaminase family protein, partial [Clostridiales bacterium]|nr:transglutaminase family protein [Clostridiales bacterium]
LLHLRGQPPRSVTGMIPGEGASHAWVEACCDGNWYGFDPTNDTIVSNSHIRIGTGRDASDCLINRGIMRGGGQQTQEVRVRVDFMN